MHKIFSKHSFLWSALAYSAIAVGAPLGENAHLLSQNKKDFIAYMVKKYNFHNNEINMALNHAKYNPKIIKLITRPAEKLPWKKYKRIFLKRQRIKNGVLFWKKYDKELKFAQQKFGVDPAFIVAIAGVETKYGKLQGKFSALNTLYTLAFYHDRPNHFFKSQLVGLFLLARQYKFDITSLKSSYAGALGIPQFMPNNYLQYAISYQKAARSDLFHNRDDVIVSIANFLKQNGWQPQAPVALHAHLTKPSHTSNAHHDIIPHIRPKDMKRLGIKIDNNMKIKQKAALFYLDNQTSKDYWLGFKNFYAIMCYNPRINYAMAVYQLAQAVRKLHDKQTTTASSVPLPTRETTRST